MYTILLPTDGSDLSKNMREQAIFFARALSARLIALHVVPEFHMPRDEGNLLSPSTSLKNRAEAEHKAKAQMLLAPVEAAARDAGLDYESVVAVNDRIYEEIVNTATARNCDLIVMAFHVHAKLTASLVGSETARVLTRTSLPVLLLH